MRATLNTRKTIVIALVVSLAAAYYGRPVFYQVSRSVNYFLSKDFIFDVSRQGKAASGCGDCVDKASKIKFMVEENTR